MECTTNTDRRSAPRQMLGNYLGKSLIEMNVLLDRWQAANRRGDAVQARDCEVRSEELMESVVVARRALSRVESRGL